MSEFVRHNVNDLVRVKLTDVGRKVHRENWTRDFGPMEKDFPYRAPTEDSEGWSEWQMWELMRQFGSACGNGFAVPFETDIFVNTRV